jgi:hypothetical protein
LCGIPGWVREASTNTTADSFANVLRLANWPVENINVWIEFTRALRGSGVEGFFEEPAYSFFHLRLSLLIILLRPAHE